MKAMKQTVENVKEHEKGIRDSTCHSQQWKASSSTNGEI